MSAALSGSDEASGDPQDQSASGETLAAYSERHGDPRFLRHRLEQQMKATERDARMKRATAAAAREQAERQQADRAAKQRRAGACVVDVILLGLVFWPGFELLTSLLSSTSLGGAAGGGAGDGGGGGQESGAGLSANQYSPCCCYLAVEIIFLTV